MKNPATIKDIARESNVSIATVSRVLNDTARVLPETRKRVEDAIRKYDYAPNALAKGLVRRHSNSIGVTLADISNPYFSRLFCEIEEIAHQEGYSVLLCNTMFHSTLSSVSRNYKEQEYFQMLLESKVAGAIIAGGQLDLPSPDPDFLDSLKRLSESVPLVILSEPIEGISACFMDREDNLGIRKAIRYLNSLGHERIAFLGGQEGVTITHRRLNVYQDMLQSLGLACDPALISLSDYYVSDGYTAARRLIERNVPFTAALAINDNVAFGVLRAFADMGIRVPQDVSLISCEEFTMPSYYTPRLTAVNRHSDRFGHLVIRTLLSIIQNQVPAEPDTVASELIIRESCAPYRPRQTKD